MNHPPSPTKSHRAAFPPPRFSNPNSHHSSQSNSNGRGHSYDEWGNRNSRSHSHDEDVGGWRETFYNGGLGRILFSTASGWQFFIRILVLWLWAAGIGLTIANRTVLWSAYLENSYTSYTRLLYLLAGAHNFPYPITTMYLQLVMAHGWLLLWASFTRLLGPFLRGAGCAGMIAPSDALYSSGHGSREKESGNGASRSTSRSFGGIAGGGIFEFDLPTAKQVMPLALIFVAKTIFSTISSTYAQFPVYVLCQVGMVPLSLLITSIMGTEHHWFIAFSSLMATLGLAASIYHPNICFSWGSMLAGILSSFFVALYPVQILRIYKSLLKSLVPQGDILSTRPSKSSPADFSGSKEEARAYWRLLHYTSLLSIIILTPIVILSGELPSFWRNHNAFDVYFYWLMLVCGSLASWALFFGTVALTRATSPLTTTFLFVFESSLILAIMIGKRLPPRSWAALGFCWMNCVLFALRRWVEERERFK